MNEQEYFHINPGYISELGDGDAEFMRDIVSEVLTTVPVTIEALARAIDANNEKEIVFWAHKLKGTFRFTGITALGNLLERMERDKLPGGQYIALLEEVKAEYMLCEREFRELLERLG